MEHNRNVFQFKSFSERISEIDIRRNVLYHINYDLEDTDLKFQTYFHNTIKKWAVLNLTDEYNNFQRVVKDIITLPQLLHKSEFIIDHLLNCLQNASVLSLQPLLEFVVVLAKELQAEFYKYLPKFLNLILKFVKSNNADEVEWSLMCLAYLFKYLKKYLKKDIKIIINLIAPILVDNESQHIQNFAMECFSYVARDIKDKDVFLQTLLEFVQNEETLTKSIGRLLFHMMLGVNGSFHNSTEPFLKNLFDAFFNEKLSIKHLFLITVNTIRSILEHIVKENIDLLWRLILTKIEKSLELYRCQKTIFLHESIQYLLKLVVIITKNKNGFFVNKSCGLLDNILGFLNLELDENLLIIIVEIATILLNSSYVNLSILEATNLSKKILSINFYNIFEIFIFNSINSYQFEAVILPQLLFFLDNRFGLTSNTLSLLTKIVLSKSMLCRDGINYPLWKKYPLAFNSNVMQSIVHQIVQSDVHSFLRNPDLIKILICIPHINNLDKEKIMDKLSLVYYDFANMILCINDSVDNSTLLIYSILLETIYHLKCNMIEISFVIETTLSLYKKCHDLNIIKILDLTLTVASQTNKNYLTYDVFLKLHSVLSDNLSSPYHKVRLLSSHILSLFCDLNNSNELFLYELFYLAENITPTIQNYRDQLLLLQKLSYGSIFYKNIMNDNILKLDPLKYLLGFLYINFRLLWEPTIELIKSHALNLPCEEFWLIYKQQLEKKSINMLKEKQHNEIDFNRFEFLVDVFKHDQEMDLRLDFVNYHMLIWKALPEFGTIHQIKNKDLVSLFFDFYEHRYKKYENQSNSYINIKIVENIESDSFNTIAVDKNEYNEIYKNIILKTLKKEMITYMDVLSKIPNQKVIHRGIELYEIYLKMLSHRHPDMQKVALDCILASKPKYLMTYKDQLYNLMNENKFKDELSNLTIIMKEDNFVEHRLNLMNIIIRILYGQMNRKSHSHLAQKMSIVRFLGSCTVNDVFIFMEMAFEAFQPFLNEDEIIICYNLIENIDLEHILHPKKLQSSLTLINLIMEEFGGLKGDSILKYMIKLLFVVGSIIQGTIIKSESINIKYLNLFKTLRTESILILNKFFEHFNNYPWNNVEIENLFNIFVWPQLYKLSSECIHSPTPLLKLFIVWSTNAKYFFLLQKYHSKDKSLNPLSCTMQLLNNKKNGSKVINAVLDIVCNLLTIEQENEKINVLSISNEHVVYNNRNTVAPLKLSENLNVGSCLLLPYTSLIIQTLKNKIVLRTKKKTIGKRNLTILNKMTELVNDTENYEVLVGILLPVLTKKIKTDLTEDFVFQVIQALINLFEKFPFSRKYIRAIVHLFESVSAISSRKLLCDLVKKICPESNISIIIEDFNALDRKWINQPDYDRRLNAFQYTNKLIDEKNIDIDIGLLVIYHSIFFLKHEKDLAIRNASSYCLKRIVIALIEKYECNLRERKYFCETILNLVSREISLCNEFVRSECIILLGELSRNYPNVHFVFRDLQLLTNKTDKEVDFFENITHMQTHRQERALKKFNKVMANVEIVPNPRTLIKFIMPIVSKYLCNDNYITRNSLVDAAVDSVAIICHLLPFNYYQTILQLYVKKLQKHINYQKQLVKLVVSIINAFHYDFSRKDKIKEKISSNIRKIELTDESKSEQHINGISSCDLKKNQSDPEYYLISRLINTLINTLKEMNSHENNHKLNRNNNNAEREEEDILRVPIALAIVQLLQKISIPMLDNCLPKILMILCTFLKSRLKSVRIVTRDILRKIMLILGPNYLHTLLDLLSTFLKRGYQVHVLVVTVYNIINALKSQLKVGDIDKNLQNMLNICLNDIFGQSSEEKHVRKIFSRTPEAKTTNKSYLILSIMASHITEKCLLDLMEPFQDHLSKSHSKKSVIKVQESFNKMLIGLAENRYISIKSLIIFIYGILFENISDLNVGKSECFSKKNEISKNKSNDIFIIFDEKNNLKKYQNLVRINMQTNAYVLLEFGLGLLYLVLKTDKANVLYNNSFLNPLIKILINLLHGSQVKVTTLALKCFIILWNKQLVTSDLKLSINEIVENLFDILKKYSSTEQSKNDENFHLNKYIYKSFMSLLRFVDYYELNSVQIKTLLLYIDQDLQSKQCRAFSLLRAIVAKRMYVSEIDDTIRFVAKLSITSELQQIREEARHILQIYFLEYPIGAKIENHLKFFIAQLSYDNKSGRESAIQMLQIIIRKIPKEIVNKNSGYMFLSLGSRLVNEDTIEIRIRVAKCIEDLLNRISNQNRNELFNTVLTLLDDNKPSYVEMAAIICTRYLKVEKDQFQNRISILLPILVSKISCTSFKFGGKYVKSIIHSELETRYSYKENQKVTIWKEKVTDHEIIQLMITIHTILEQFPNVLKDIKYNLCIEELSYQCQRLVAHQHVWIRIHATKIIGFVLNAIDFELLGKCLRGEIIELKSQYLYSNPTEQIKSLVLDMCAQLQPEKIEADMAEEIMRNLLVIAKILTTIPLHSTYEHDYNGLNIFWLIRRMRYVSNREAIKVPKSTILRTAIFAWIQGLVHLLNVNIISTVAESLISPLIRELSDDKNVHPKLSQIAIKVSSKIKNKIGETLYNRVLHTLQMKQLMKKSERKKKLIIEKIKNPVKAAKRKASQQERKKTAKKRKMDLLRGKLHSS